MSNIEPDLTGLSGGARYRGCVEYFSGDAVTGWCVLAANPSAAVELEMFRGDTLIGTTVTGISRPDISEIVGYPVRAGFSFPNTHSYDDISVRVLASGDVLSFARGAESPQYPNSSGAAHEGCLEHFVDGTIGGWCVLKEDPSSQVELEVYLGQVAIGAAYTSIGRVDISKNVGFPVRAGFEFRSAETASPTLRDAIAALSSAVGDVETLDRIFSVRVAGSTFTLPYGDSFRVMPADAYALLETLELRFGDVQRNRSIGDIASLAADSEIPDIATDFDARVVAFYLPQFHPFAQNDDWWGPGFTEWTNVTTARPSFAHHYQPRLPADLGFYDLRLDSVHAAQVEMARKYGISAFCYHHYWFSGTTLMAMPVERHVRENYPLDFCLSWANENWSRRWDGSEADVLMSQHHSEADDVAFIDSVIDYFRHPRYIKIDGAPLLIIYRISILSNPERVVRKWKEIVRKAGFPDLHVCMAETFGTYNPNEFGADSSVEFPPHHIAAPERTREAVDLAPGFTGYVYDYAEAASIEMRRKDAGYLRFRTVMPSWDNTSRKGLDGFIFHNSSPQIFEAWLSHALAKTRRDHPAGSRFVFINAWNEWAESAYLEPDRRNGHAYLRAVRNALSVQGALYGEMLLPDTTAENSEFREQALRVVTTLSNANRYLAAFLSDGARMGGVPSPFIERPDTIRSTMAVPEARMQIESVNGRTVSRQHEATVLRCQNLELVGWLYVPGVVQTSDRPVFVVLEPLDRAVGATEYLATVHERKERSDVGEAFGDLGAQEYGFVFAGDLRRVPCGSYTVGALVASGRSASDAINLSSDLIIHVG